MLRRVLLWFGLYRYRDGHIGLAMDVGYNNALIDVLLEIDVINRDGGDAETLRRLSVFIGDQKKSLLK